MLPGRLVSPLVTAAISRIGDFHVNIGSLILWHAPKRRPPVHEKQHDNHKNGYDNPQNKPRAHSAIARIPPAWVIDNCWHGNLQIQNVNLKMENDNVKLLQPGHF